MFQQREFHDLHTGDRFSFEQGGPVYLVDDGDFIDQNNEDFMTPHRLVLYRTEDGYHGHQANHDLVWVVTD